ncbi:unnamed protein product [Rhizophagus irregularis]|nr:unnamed protein product [Rhizophagus irregularis]CAB5352494.1 unnamed protein product [Rhizophagus irregularis]
MDNIAQVDQSNIEKFRCEVDKVPFPLQFDSFVSEYIKMIKLHSIGIGKDLDDIDVKVKFISGLSPDNEKRVNEFGVKKPLSEIFEHLLKPSSKPTCPEY